MPRLPVGHNRRTIFDQKTDAPMEIYANLRNVPAAQPLPYRAPPTPHELRQQQITATEAADRRREAQKLKRREQRQEKHHPRVDNIHQVLEAELIDLARAAPEMLQYTPQEAAEYIARHRSMELGDPEERWAKLLEWSEYAEDQRLVEEEAEDIYLHQELRVYGMGGPAAVARFNEESAGPEATYRRRLIHKRTTAPIVNPLPQRPEPTPVVYPRGRTQHPRVQLGRPYYRPQPHKAVKKEVKKEARATKKQPKEEETTVVIRRLS